AGPSGNAEAEEPRGVQTKHLRAGCVAQPTHRALDRLRRVRARTLVMRVVVAPHEIVDEGVTLREVETRLVLLKRCEAMQAEVLARQFRELRPHPEVVLQVRLVHRSDEPRNPADARLDRRQPQAWKAVEGPLGA